MPQQDANEAKHAVLFLTWAKENGWDWSVSERANGKWYNINHQPVIYVTEDQLHDIYTGKIEISAIQLPTQKEPATV